MQETMVVVDQVFADPDLFDSSERRYFGHPNRGRIIRGDRCVLSEMWNQCYAAADPTSQIMMHCGDDIVFQTPAWDLLVRQTFEEYPDRIVLVHGRDGLQDDRMSTHGFYHRRWIDAVGYFMPPYFSSDWNDHWWYEVANAIGRRRYLSELYTEHMHPVNGKGPWDRTHQERMARHSRDDVDGLFRRLAPERQADADKLRTVIRGG